MSRALRLLGLTLVVALAAFSHSSAAPLSDSSVGVAWAGHPVTFALLTERDHQFVAYYDAERHIAVAGRRLGTDAWTVVRPEGAPHPRAKRLTTVTEWDSHNYLALALDRAGHLHLSGNMHNDPLVYFRSAKPFDVASLVRLDRMTGQREQRVTYPVFFKTAAGDLLFRYRDGGSGDGADLYNRYDTDTRAWSRLLDVPLLDGQRRRNAYALPPVLGPDGRFHLVWMWRDTPGAATNHTLSYARSDDFVHWEKSDGTPLPLPITLDAAEVIDPVPAQRGLINMTFALGFDARRRPVAIYHRYDEAGRSQAYAARPPENSAASAGPWLARRVSDWDFRWQFGGGGSLDAEILLGPPAPLADGSLVADFITLHRPAAGRLRFDADTLAPLETLPALPPALPASLATPESSAPGLEVQTISERAAGRLWVLRWETLPRNRDLPRDRVPPPSRLRVIELPDREIGRALRVGS